ncbi:MAG: aminotransferase class IV [Gemmatimonadota bacterium]
MHNKPDVNDTHSDGGRRTGSGPREGGGPRSGGGPRFWSSPGAPVHDCGCIPISERGFRYGDGVFVTLACRGRRLLDLDAHMERLRRACELTGLVLPAEVGGPAEVACIVAGLGAADADDADAADGVVRIQVSAGGSGRGYGREEDSGWALVELLAMPPARSLTVALQQPGTVLPLPSLPGVKTCSALPLVLLAREARRLGCHEVIRVQEGLVTEAGSANVFWWSGGSLHTPGESAALYPGVTRQVVLAVAAEIGFPVQSQSADPASLRDAEAVFLTNAVRGVERSRSLGGRALGWPGELEELARAVESRRLADSHALGTGD